MCKTLSWNGTYSNASALVCVDENGWSWSGSASWTGPYGVASGSASGSGSNGSGSATVSGRYVQGTISW